MIADWGGQCGSGILPESSEGEKLQVISRKRDLHFFPPAFDF
jgi:hypothetical protein